MCEELQTFIQDSKEVLWSEVRHIPDTAKALVDKRGAWCWRYLYSDDDQLQHTIKPTVTNCEHVEGIPHIVLSPR